MSRYFVQHKPRPIRSYDDWEPIGNSWHIPAVADHEAAETGLFDGNGDPIMRAPNPMGFIHGDWRAK